MELDNGQATDLDTESSIMKYLHVSSAMLNRDGH